MGLGISGALLERGERIRVAPVCDEAEVESSTGVWGVICWKSG